MRRFPIVVVFPIFGLALLLPKLQILWWSLARGLAHLGNGVDASDLLADAGSFDSDPALDGVDEYTHLRLG